MSADDQQELFAPDFGWFHFFRTIIKNDTWAKMSLASKALYPVVKSYVASENGAAFPSYDTLAKKSGLSLQSVSKALNELAELGMITATKAVGKKSIYSMKETFDVHHPISGRAGTVSFDYVPQLVQKAVEEMKALITTGAQGKIIQINFNVNCTGDITSNNAQVMVDGMTTDGAGDIIKMLEEKERLQVVDNS